jgi:hypothetical protein
VFCGTRLVFDGTEGVPSCFHVVCSRKCFWRYRGRRVPFSRFALPNSFLAVLGVTGPVFLFCAPGLIFDGTGASGPVFIFRASGLVFSSTEGVGSRFRDLHGRNRFRWYRGRPFPISCFALLVPSRTYSWRYQGRRVLFSRFALPNSFLAVPAPSGPVSLFCVPGLIFCGSEGVVSRFHVFRSRTYFRRFRRRRACFYVLRARIHFRRYRGRREPFSYFVLPDSFSAVPRV